MGKDPVGYRFSPTAEELIIYYLMNKILGLMLWLVDEAISEINLCSYEPEFLPSLAKIKTDDDLVWYFFCPIEYTTAKNKATKRSTGSGFWKPTGEDRKIKDKRGKGVEIGLKKTLVYYQGKARNAVRTPWIIHEYHITCLPQNQRPNYVICQVMYNGEDGDTLYGNTSNEPTSHQSLASVSNTFRAINTAPEVELEQPVGMSVDDLVIPVNVSLSDGFNPNSLFNDNNNMLSQTPCDDNPNVWPLTPYFDRGLDQLELEENLNRFSDNDLIAGFDQDLMMQENRNEHRPKKALSGIFVDYSSDSGSDAESISATSYKGTSSPGSSNVASPIPSCSSTDSCKDLQTSADPSITRKTKKYQLTSKQEVKQGTPRADDASIDNESSFLVKTEKKDAMERNRKNPRYIDFINMIVGFIILLALIRNIISVY